MVGLNLVCETKLSQNVDIFSGVGANAIVQQDDDIWNDAFAYMHDIAEEKVDDTKVKQLYSFIRRVCF